MKRSDADKLHSTSLWPRWTKRLSLGVISILLLVTGIWGAWESGNRADQRFRRDLARKALAVAAAIPVDEAQRLTFTEADRNLPEYQRISAQLKTYSHAAGLRCLYTMALHDGQIYFGPEGLDPDSPLASPVGTVYEEPTEEDFQTFETAEPLVQGPDEDEYGPYIAATAPVVDPKTGKVMLMVGLDEDPASWRAEVRKAQLIPLLIPVTGFIVLLATMLLLRLRFRLESKRQRLERFFMVEMVSCAIIMLLLTVGSSLLIRQMDKTGRDEIFNTQAQLKVNAYMDSLRAANDYLIALSDTFFASSEFVSRSEFDTFCNKAVPSRLVQTTAWLPEVPAGKRTEFEQQVREDDWPGFTIHPADGPVDSTAHRLYPMLYMVSETGSKQRLGEDLYSNPDCRVAIDDCLHSGHPTASIASLQQDTNSNDRAVVYVFEPARSQKQNGIVALAVDLSRLKGRVVTGTTDLSVSLQEITPDGTPHTLICSRTDCDGDCLRCFQNEHLAIFPFFAFGKTYTMMIAPDAQWYKSHPLRNQQIAMVAGLILTVLSTGLVGLLANRSLILERMVQERTSELQRSEERFDMAASAAGIGVWDFELAGKQLVWDSRMCQLYGIDPSEFTGAYEQWEHFIHEDDLEHLRSEIAAALNGEKPLNTEFRIKRPDGEVRRVHAYAKVLHNPRGKPARMIGANLDITENKAREERITTQLDELNRWQNVIVGREHRLIELKAEVNALCAQLNQNPRYTVGNGEHE